MSRQKNRKPRPGPTAMTREQVQRIQQLRRSNAAGPTVKRSTRAADKRQAIKSGW